MSTPDPQPTPPGRRPRRRPVSRWGVGTLSLVQLACLTVIVLAVNYLAGIRHARLDLSRTREFTLSNVTRRLLAGDELQRRTEPVRLIVAHKRSSPFYDRLRALAEEYRRLANGKIAVEFIDPVRSADLTLQLAARYHIEHFTRNLVIIDAREGAAAAAAAEDAGPDPDFSARVRFVDEAAMAVHEVDAYRQRRPVAFQAEDALTAALLSAVEGKPRRVYLLADKSDLDTGKDRTPWQVLGETLLYRNIETVPVRISELERIADDARAVLLVAPAYDLEERELAVLEEYWARPRSALFIAVDPAARPPRLRAFLRRHGVTPANDRVIARAGGRTTGFVRATFTPGLEFTRDLWGQSTVLEGSTCSLEVRESDEGLLNLRITPFKLIEAAADFWGETRFQQPEPAFDAREDHAAPVAVAAAVVRGAASDDRFAKETSRMIVLGNSGFLDPAGLRPEMIDFLHSAMSWLIGREQLAGIGPRSLAVYKLPLLEPQVAFVNRVNLLFLPVAALVVGLAVWQSRRS